MIAVRHRLGMEGCEQGGSAMELLLKREKSSAQSTIGELFIDGEHECFTLEDIVRPQKVKNETAIPAGTYNVVLTHSPRFDRDMPLLENVPNYEGVRIHWGNTAKDTEGCILVGTTKGKDFIGQSRDEFAALFDKLREAIDNGEKVSITITDAA
jgi:hypothetical protein